MWKKFLKTSIKDEVQIELLRTWLSRLLLGLNLNQMLLLYGPRTSGKTLLAHVIKSLVPEKNVMYRIPNIHQPLQRYYLKDTRLIYISESEVRNLSRNIENIKVIMEGGKLTGRQKYQKDLEKFMVNCALIAETNVVPKLDTYMQKRILFIETVKQETINPDLYKSLFNEIDYIHEWCNS